MQLEQAPRRRAARSAAKLVVGTLNVCHRENEQKKAKCLWHLASKNESEFKSVLPKEISLCHYLVARQDLQILPGTITGWTVNAGLGPPVSYPTIVLYCILMRPFVSVRDVSG